MVYVPPLASSRPSKEVNIASPSTAVPIAQYVAISHEQTPITHVISLIELSKEEEEEEVEVIEVKRKLVKLVEGKKELPNSLIKKRMKVMAIGPEKMQKEFMPSVPNKKM